MAEILTEDVYQKGEDIPIPLRFDLFKTDTEIITTADYMMAFFGISDWNKL